MSEDEEDFKQIDLCVPADAREFLSNLRVDGRAVTKFYTNEGRTLSVDQMSDKEAVSFAQQLHQEMFDGADYVNTDIDRGLN